MSIYAFTSITLNYVPKARVLSTSLRSLHPEWKFCLLVAEPVPDELRDDCLKRGDVDEILTLDSLEICGEHNEPLEGQQLEQWVFKHSLVELCTAVKGPCLDLLLKRDDCEAVFYFDPDIAVFSRLDALTARFDSASILLTPHQTAPEQSLEAIIDNEVCSLKHGVYNLGFLGVKKSHGGLAFASWWKRRLELLCYSDIPNGIFTDQRWVDLAPGFFDDVGIVREPVYNVSTWNLTHRNVEGDVQDGLFVNGQALGFYHFSGFDSGAQLTMLNKYGSHMPTLYELRDWYIRRCAEFDDERYSHRPWRYQYFANGEPVRTEERLLYRLRRDLQKAFPSPFQTDDINLSYYDWYRVNVGEESSSGESQAEKMMLVYRSQLEQVYASRSWKLAQAIVTCARFFRIRNWI